MSREIAYCVASTSDLLVLYKSKGHRDTIINSLLTDAILIPKKIAQAESSKSYSVKISSAVFIHTITQNITSYCRGLEMDGLKEKDYLSLLQKELKLFRQSFMTWQISLGESNDSF